MSNNLEPLKIYIAGPMRGIPGDNRDAFAAAATLLRGLGHTVVSPAEYDIANDIPSGGIDRNALKKAMLWDLQQIAECDCVVLLDDWIQSGGVRLELEMARFCGCQVKSVREFEAAQ